ncbi:hypothetical protein FC52_GL001322 [Lactobacillus pasteurii DSM 23907 = CRBIP 24.76]|nr:hypothetical protein FC52_GL001322 [Lactobacillus pasteurii DSM 23907 = CRBIP 24.76]
MLKMNTKSIKIDLNFDNGELNMAFSDNLTKDEERGYILSAAFLSYSASKGLSKEDVMNMVNDYYDQIADQK